SNPAKVLITNNRVPALPGPPAAAVLSSYWGPRDRCMFAVFRRSRSLKSEYSSRPQTMTKVTHPKSTHQAVGGADRRHLGAVRYRSEEHTSELQSLTNLVCRLL